MRPRRRVQRPHSSAPRAHRDRRRSRRGRSAAGRGPVRPALARVRRRADLRRQVEPHLPRRVRCGRGHPAASAARPRPAHRPRHGPRAPRPVGARADGGPGAPDAASRRRRRSARRPVLRDGAGARARLPQRAAARLRGDADQRAAIGEALVETLAELHAIDPAAVGLAEFGRPAGLHGAPAAPLVQAVGGHEGRRAAGARRAP